MDGVWLVRSGPGMAVELSEGELLHLPSTVVEASVPLATAKSSFHGVDHVHIRISPESIRAWNSFRERPDASHNVDSLLLAAEAAAYLGDDASLPTLHGLLADTASSAIERQLEMDLDAGLPGQRGGGGAVKEVDHAGEVWNALPTDDAFCVLRAAFAKLPFRLDGATWHRPTAPDSPFRTSAMHAAMSTLPHHLWPLVLRAVDPHIDTHRSFTLAKASLGATERAMAAVSSSLCPRIEALTLQDLADEGLSDALCSVLPALPQLTRLRLRGVPPSAGSRSKCLSALSVLCALRELDVGGCRVAPDDGDGCSVRALAGALRELGALSHLAMPSTAIGSSGWAVLREAVCSTTMRLRVLDLECCGLDDSFRLLPEASKLPTDSAADASTPPPSMSQPAALEGLWSLGLSQNSLSVGVLCAALAPLTCLTALHMPDVLPADGDEDHDAELRSAITHAGTSRLQVLTWRLPPRTASSIAVHPLLSAWSELRTLSLQRKGGGVVRACAPLAGLHPAQCMPRLQSLSLRSISMADVAPLSRVLGACPGLTSLTLGWDGHHSNWSMRKIATLFTQLTHLEHLCLSNSSRACDMHFAAGFVCRLQPLVNLTSLTLDSLPLGMSSAIVGLADVLSGMHGLQELMLDACALAGSHVDLLLPELARKTALRVLSVCGVREPHDYGKKWAQVLLKMTSLEDLQLKASSRIRGLENLIESAPPSLQRLRL